MTADYPIVAFASATTQYPTFRLGSPHSQTLAAHLTADAVATIFQRLS